MLGEIPPVLRLLRSADHDLHRLRRRNPAEFRQVWADVCRLASGTLPAQGKRLRTIPAFQVDAGRFRIVYTWEGELCLIMAVFAKPEQHRRFRHWK